MDSGPPSPVVRPALPGPGVRPARHRRALLGVVAVGAAVIAAVIAGCGGADRDDRAGTPGGAPPGARGPERPADRGRAAWAGAGDDHDVVARRRVSAARPDGAPSGTRVSVDLVIRGLTVRGRVATLRVSAVPHGWGAVRADTGGAPTLYDLNPGPRAAYVTAQLIDAERLRLHLPLEDSEGEGVASMTYAGKVSDGQALDASWLFAAPPPDVDAMDVQVGNWPVFREVPVTRR